MTSYRPFTAIAALIFAVVALLHAYRLVTRFEVVFGSCVIPLWASWLGMIVAGILAVMLFKEAKS